MEPAKWFFAILFGTCCSVAAVLATLRVKLSAPKNVRPGGAAFLSCSPSGLEEEGGLTVLSVRWFHGGREFYSVGPGSNETRDFSVPGLRVNRSVSRGGLLLLGRVGRSAAGRYTCRVTAEDGRGRTLTGSAEGELVLVGRRRRRGRKPPINVTRRSSSATEKLLLPYPLTLLLANLFLNACADL